MCLSDLVRLSEVSADGGSAIGISGDRQVEVSLVVLSLDGIRASPGDWVVMSTGLAVERLTEAEVEAIHAARVGIDAAAPTAPVHQGDEPRTSHPATTTEVRP